VDAPDATWDVEEACGFGLDEPRAGQSVEEHQDCDRGKGGADPTEIGDQEGHDPLPGDANHGENPERDQGKQRQGRGRVRLGVEGEQLDHGAEEFVGVGHEWDGVALGWAELIVWSASRPGRRRATGPVAGSTALYDRGRPHQAQAPLPHNSGLTSH
jgi:hypothetical protein